MCGMGAHCTGRMQHAGRCAAHRHKLQVPDALVSFAAAPHYMLHYACVEVS